MGWRQMRAAIAAGLVVAVRRSVAAALGSSAVDGLTCAAALLVTEGSDRSRHGVQIRAGKPACSWAVTASDVMCMVMPTVGERSKLSGLGRRTGTISMASLPRSRLVRQWGIADLRRYSFMVRSDRQQR